MRSLALGFGVGVVVGGAVTGFALLNLQPSASGKDVGRRKSNLDGIQYHPALKYGLPTSGLGSQNLKFYDGFVAAFDTKTRNPAWVLEYIEWKETLEEGVDRSRSRFYEDEDIEERFRNRISDFHKSGYDRGHLAPAGSHMHSQKAMDETFTMNNISPQVGKGFNRSYWARFEKFVKGLAKNSVSVYVVTGPLWLPKKDRKTKEWMMQYPMIGEPPSLISVPTHFYKVILSERKEGKTGVGAFVMPNEQIEPSTPLAQFATPINDLECAAGLKFFPLYLDDSRMRALDSAALEWKGYGSRQNKAEITKRLSEIKDGNDDQTETTSNSMSEDGAERDLVVVHPQKATGGKKIPKTGPSGRGAIHLCEQTGCKIPAEEFWLKKK